MHYRHRLLGSGIVKLNILDSCMNCRIYATKFANTKKVYIDMNKNIALLVMRRLTELLEHDVLEPLVRHELHPAV